MLNGSSILITGGTGSFGHAFVPMTLKKGAPRRLIIYSRDEMKQWEMAKHYGDDPRVRFFLGDVRDKDRLRRALDGVDYVVHAAATKIVPLAEYNPFECVKTNVLGAMNMIDACIDQGVKRVVALALLGPALAYAAAAGLVLFLAAPLIPRWLGDSYEGTVPVVQWLAWLPLATFPRLLMQSVLARNDLQIMGMMIVSLGALANIGLNILWIPIWGWQGAIMATYVAELVMVVVILSTRRLSSANEK